MERRSKNIEQKDLFYIYTNGKETETNYLNLLKSKKSIFKVNIKFENGDPLRLVHQAFDQSITINQIWCVFDIDNSYEDGRLREAINFAHRNNINIAFSNKAFEVWLLSHYNKITI